MRIIAGSHGGRRLKGPDTPSTRPVTDRVKESIFSSLGARVHGARVLDLYAGVGSFGIEALSRGAREVTFVEHDRRALAALRSNLADLGMEATVVAGRVEDHTGAAPDSFDLVFCDPPWPLPASELTAVLEEIAPAVAGLVVVTRRASDPVPAPAGYAIDDERRHGDTRIIRYSTERDPS